jgi:3-hydroxyacyl-CoA dehydrogenase
MAKLVDYAKQDGVAVLTVENPPVNALSAGVPEGLMTALDRAQADEEVTAIVLMGAGRTFIAGADIGLLQEMAWGRAASDLTVLHELLRKIEDSAKPVVIAIHGSALGGGLEVAMAGHWRVALETAQLGQPEVNLGLIPGAEGTQRLPRLVGVAKAIEMCVSGKPMGASEALRAGLIDAVVSGDLLQEAMKMAGPVRRTRERNERLDGRAGLFEEGRRLAEQVRPKQAAPLRAVEAIEAAATLDFAAGCRREKQIFNECLAGEQAKAMMHAFFAERTAGKVPGFDKNAAALAIRRVGVIGAGTMGGGIAMAFVNAGIPVVLKDANAQALEAGMANIARNYENSVRRGRFTAQETERRIGMIQAQTSYEGFGEMDLIVEAVFENLALKKRVFHEMDEVARPGCVLATNTSMLSIDEMAGVTQRPEFVVGLHFFSPANVMRLVEVVRGKATSAEVLATALAVAKQLRKVGVVAGNCPGFVGNRMFFPYAQEAQFLVEEGATPEQVDRALTDFGMAMGPFAVDDLAGIDVMWRIRQDLGMRRPVLQDKLYALGRYGQKTGKGWYRYGADRKPVVDGEVTALLTKRRDVGDEEIVQRTIFALINEGARVLGEGYALRASDIDVIYTNGYGFPVWRGGPMFHADRTGLARIVEAVEGFGWEAAPLLRELAASGRTFRELDNRG